MIAPRKRALAAARVLLISLTLSLHPFALEAKPKVACEVKLLARHPSIVTFTWEVRVESDRPWDACDLVISFEDERGMELHSLRETLSVKAGRSTFSGHDICDAGVWDRIVKYVATFDCVF
jgi:hypothetical protein